MPDEINGPMASLPGVANESMQHCWFCAMAQCIAAAVANIGLESALCNKANRNASLVLIIQQLLSGEQKGKPKCHSMCM